jgi:hypothetical protein
MLFFDGGLGLIMFGVWLFCIIDVITTPDQHTRNLPKVAWLLIVILLLDVGSIAWLVAGRRWNRDTPAAPKRAAGFTNPDDDEEFLASLRARAAEQRRRGQEAQQRETGMSSAMAADVNPERPLGEKGSQQVHPDKPTRDEGAAHGDPNETPAGRPQHEPRDPDEKEW